MYRSNTYDVSLPQDSIQRYNSVMKRNDPRSPQDVPVVVVRNAYKSYYRGKLPVLEDFSMTVRKGTIYSLLGSSGCGKTTTLSCIVGVQKLKSGSIFVFGSTPGARNVSQSRIGYMPQDISLYGDFSIAENLNYFGTLCGMDQYFVASQIFYLTKLLDLPPVDRRAGSLRIWDYLISLTRTKKTTILLTTHYIDEAKPFQMVGVMREGRLIAEDSPIHLMEKYNTSSLETVILNLCKERNPPPQAIEYYVNYGETKKKTNYMEESVRRIKALIGKNTVIMFRNIFESDFHSCFDPTFSYDIEGECSLEMLGCRFLRHIPNDAVELEPYETIEDAITDVENAKIRGFLVIPEDYSNSYYEWVTSGGIVDDYVLNNSKITLRLDKTNRYISGVIEKTMYETLEAYSKQILSDCGFDPRQVESPLQYLEPIFGSGMTLMDSIGPGVGVLMVVFFPMLSTSIRFIGEKKQGTLGRSLVSGASLWEIIVAYTVTEFTLILAQGGFVFIVLRIMSGKDPVGSSLLFLTLSVMVGICGMVLVCLID
ncbi:ABC transporter G family member 23 [Orchesella cincta]|uniref:ABC transporter G family member 23 n=1 Tax=Orchesella cincta TaxID=48709 RepID=A0A1D2MKA5_ORCCI|nr:ABC transporter G family member 23 [Orchesella cincta]